MKTQRTQKTNKQKQQRIHRKEQNGEQFERQHIGHIDSGVEIFENTGDVDVTFEVVE